ncbi:Uncharacterised protein g8790 [Pycnogonum litorale]
MFLKILKITLFCVHCYCEAYGNSWNQISTNSVNDEPYLSEYVKNVTIMDGRDAILSCTVKNLADYKVAWVKVDTQTILTLELKPITRDPRFKVTQSNQENWYLHINKVAFEDRGFYMCQVNTQPMKHRNIYLEIRVPPKVIETDTSSTVKVKEFSSVSLQCRARGFPTPMITWEREDNKLIKLDVDRSDKSIVRYKEGEFLNVTRVTRKHMGAYLCIASNDVPPSVSKRIELEVTFPPKIRVPHQLVGAPRGTEVQLRCEVESFPEPMRSWQKYETFVVADERHQLSTVILQKYRTLMQLTIMNLQKDDYGAYKCIATNTIGKREGIIRLYETYPDKIQLRRIDKIKKSKGK